MEECLTILKKIHDRRVKLTNKNQRYMGPSSTRWIFVNFASALMIPILYERVGPVKYILNNDGVLNGISNFMYN